MAQQLENADKDNKLDEEDSVPKNEDSMSRMWQQKQQLARAMAKGKEVSDIIVQQEQQLARAMAKGKQISEIIVQQEQQLARAIAKGKEVSDVIVQQEQQLARAMAKGKQVSEIVVQQQQQQGRCTELPDAIKLDICSRLPPNQYFQAKCLSKFFEQELSHSMVLKVQPLLTVLVKSDQYDGLLGVELAWFKLRGCGHKVEEVVGVWKGLACLYTTDASMCHHYVVHNPVTSESLIIPCPPLFGIVMHGFGESAGGVLKIATFAPAEQAVLTLGSFGTAKWERSKRSVNHSWADIDYQHREMVSLNGSLHWLSVSGILHCNLNTNKLETYTLPEYVFVEREDDTVYRNQVVALGKLEEKLCVLVRCRYDSVVYIMEDYGVEESWVKRMAIGIRGTIHTQILGYNADTLVLVHEEKLGFVEYGRTFAIWCRAEGIQSAFVIEPTLLSLKELKVKEVDDHLVDESDPEEEKSEDDDDRVQLEEDDNAEDYPDMEESDESDHEEEESDDDIESTLKMLMRKGKNI